MTPPTRRPRGRPRSDASRGSRLELRVHPSEHVLLGQAAELTGEAVAAWVRGVAVEAARVALAEHGPMPEVEPCPQCGRVDDVRIEEYGPGDWHVSCDECCEGTAHIATASTRRGAVDAWRTHTTVAPSKRGRAARGTTRT